MLIFAEDVVVQQPETLSSTHDVTSAPTTPVDKKFWQNILATYEHSARAVFRATPRYLKWYQQILVKFNVNFNIWESILTIRNKYKHKHTNTHL